jgi:hypothetical protein
LRQINRIARIRVIEDDGELIPSDASCGVSLAQSLLETPRYFYEEQIADVVAEGIVDHLEAVKVAEQDGDGNRGSPSTR